LCNSFDHATNSCPYYACYDQYDFVSPWDNTDVVLNLRDSSFRLAQCTGLKKGDPLGFDARFDFADACFELEDIFDKVLDLGKTPLGGALDVLVHEESPSLGFHDIVLPNPLDHSHVSPTCLQHFISPEYSLDAPIDNHKICDSNVELGHDDNEFNVLGGSINDFRSLGYFSWYNA